ncbi:MAG TPA: ribbon-helix-helix protein, CopG family [Longimicrobiaceae bacterium]|nr:ribbon-helix-helix protein, CopG family [Longimicrobiaceae bacterium]
MTTLQIELSDEMLREIERLAGQAGLDRNEFIADAIRRRIELARTAYTTRMGVEEFEAGRERLRPYAERAGYTDEAEILNDRS